MEIGEKGIHRNAQMAMERGKNGACVLKGKSEEGKM